MTDSSETPDLDLAKMDDLPLKSEDVVYNQHALKKRFIQKDFSHSIHFLKSNAYESLSERNLPWLSSLFRIPAAYCKSMIGEKYNDGSLEEDVWPQEKIKCFLVAFMRDLRALARRSEGSRDYPFAVTAGLSEKLLAPLRMITGASNETIEAARDEAEGEINAEDDTCKSEAAQNQSASKEGANDSVEADLDHSALEMDVSGDDTANKPEKTDLDSSKSPNEHDASQEPGTTKPKSATHTASLERQLRRARERIKYLEEMAEQSAIVIADLRAVVDKHRLSSATLAQITHIVRGHTSQTKAAGGEAAFENRALAKRAAKLKKERPDGEFLVCLHSKHFPNIMVSRAQKAKVHKWNAEAQGISKLIYYLFDIFLDASDVLNYSLAELYSEFPTEMNAIHVFSRQFYGPDATNYKVRRCVSDKLTHLPGRKRKRIFLKKPSEDEEE